MSLAVSYSVFRSFMICTFLWLELKVEEAPSNQVDRTCIVCIFCTWGKQAFRDLLRKKSNPTHRNQNLSMHPPSNGSSNNPNPNPNAGNCFGMEVMEVMGASTNFHALSMGYLFNLNPNRDRRGHWVTSRSQGVS